MERDGLGDVGAFDVLGHVLVVDPAQAVAGDLPVGGLHRRDRLWVHLHGLRDPEHGDGQAALGEDPWRRQNPARLPYS